MRLRLADVADATGGTASAGDVVIDGAASDHRDVRAGCLFVALAGARVDGHEYVQAAFDAGAAAALVSRRDEWGGRPLVRVRDTLGGLLDLGASVRDRVPHRVGITGSSGKTITKDLVAAVLATRFAVGSSPRSFNTEVGVPLAVLNAPDATEALVLEMGARGTGHIRSLCRLARPTVGVVTNVGPAHLGMFGSLDNVARAKAELIEELPPGGAAILNADDARVAGFGSRSRARVITYGLRSSADVRAEELELDDDARPSFTLLAGGERARVDLTIPGEHMVPNALAAAAAGLALGVTPAECAAALKGAAISSWRMQVHERPDGVRIVNDAYNANPASTAAALRAARWMSRNRRCWAVLGEMAELGDFAVDEHDRVGRQVARLGIEELVTVGERARVIARAAVREGVGQEHVRETASAEEALAVVAPAVRPGDVVLVKGSRVAALDRVADGLAAEGEGPA